MKKTLCLLLVTVILLFSGCNRQNINEIKSVKFENKIYKTGFYGTMFPYQFDYDKETFTVNNIEYKKIKHDTFNLIHADIGHYVEGTVFCDESQYDDACLYYSDPENFSYYCILGVDSADTVSQTVQFDDIDADKFNALLTFAENSEYIPFDSKHNDKIEKTELPMPDDKKDKRLTFYKSSNDLLFIFGEGYDFYIIDGILYSVYQYDFGHGEYEKLIAVKAPSDISDYFTEFMKPYLL